MAIVRIQKILAQAGVSSRRAAERLIVEGRVRVDGRVVTELGTKADSKAKIELDGKRIVQDQFCYGVMNKPRGMLTTLSDPEGRPTIGSILKQVGLRVIPVGRLDFNTSGVLLFTNDGDFAQALAHVKGKVPKVYIAKVRGELDERELARWAERIEIDGRKTEPASVRALRREGGHTWLEVTIYEGRNRQVRRLGEHAGTPLVRLVRVSHAGIDAEGLRPGEWRLLTIDELKALKAAYGTPKKIRGVAQGLVQTEGQRNAAAREKFEKIREKWRTPRAPEERGAFAPRGKESREQGASRKEAGARAYERGSKQSARAAPRATNRVEGDPRSRRQDARAGAARSSAKGRPLLRSEAEASARPRRSETNASARPRRSETTAPARPRRPGGETSARPERRSDAGAKARPRKSEGEASARPRQVKRAGGGSGFAPRPKTRR